MTDSSNLKIDQGIGNRNYFRRYDRRGWKYYRYIIAQIIQFSKPGPILDVGAGTGLFIEAARRWGLNCMGTDGSKVAINLAKKRYPKAKITLHQLSQPLSFKANSFQTVVLNQVIGMLEPKVTIQTLSEIYRVLKPTGLLFINSPSRYNREVKKTDPAIAAFPYSPSQLKKALSRIGYINISAANIPVMYLGNSHPAQLIMHALLRLTRWDFFSATNNFYAYK